MSKKGGCIFIIVGLIIGFGAILALLNPLKLVDYRSKAEPNGTPFDTGIWEDVPPFTDNDNKKLPLLWSVRMAVPKGDGYCHTKKGVMNVSPNTIVFVKFSDGSSGVAELGTRGDRRKLRPIDQWYGIKFVSNPNYDRRTEIRITNKQEFVICDPTENLVLHLEARRLR